MDGMTKPTCLTWSPPRHGRGMTLIEFLTALAVLAVLLAVAVPSFHESFLNSKLTSQANGFLSSLLLARSEAIKTNGRVALCKSANGTACVTTGGWHQGWVVFRDANNNASLDAGEIVIQRGDPLADGFSLTGNTNVANYISYTSTGSARLTSGALQAGTLILCRFAPTVGGSNRSVVVSGTGRARIESNDNVTTCP